MSWCPLFPQITGSSVWDLPPHIFKSWISIISHKNHETHTWRGNAYTLAKQATISLEQAKEAMKVLSEPDERSLTKDHDGKRIISDDGENWFVVNSEKYQEMIKREIALENARARTAKWRKNKKSSTGNNGVALPASFPTTEEEAIQQCSVMAPQVPAETILTYFHDAVGRGGKDYKGTQIMAWPNYVLGQWRKFGNSVPGVEKSRKPKPPTGDYKPGKNYRVEQGEAKLPSIEELP